MMKTTKWFIEVTPSNIDILNYWRKQVCLDGWKHAYVYVGQFIVDKYVDGSYYFTGGKIDLIEQGYEEIDYDTFSEISGILCYTVTREQFKKGYELACSEWKDKLKQMFSEELFIHDTIVVDKDFINELRNVASNSKQTDFLNELFPPSVEMDKVSDLHVGQTLLVEVGAHKGCFIMRTYSGYVNLNDPLITWSDYIPQFFGKKVEIDIKIKD